MARQVLGEETVCPECGSMFQMNVDVGDGFLHDVCFGCGFKRKKKKDGTSIEKQEQESE